MPAYLKKTKAEILNAELTKIQRNTPITFVGPGSIARAFAEAVSTELGDMYDLMDYNTSQMLITTATGSALDLLGSLYDTTRKQVSDLTAVDKRLGSFIFYLQTPHASNITIPQGTNIYTDTSSYMGQRFSYSTTEDVVIPAGRTRVYASIIANFSDVVYTAGVRTLVVHDFQSPPGVTVLCTNPKAISPQLSYESDEQYRVRLIKAIRVASSGTLEATRYAGLAVSGVRDIKIRQAPYGLGSFEAIIVPERNTNAGDVMVRATAAMDQVRPMGVRMYSKVPVYIQFDLTLGIIAPTAISSQTREMVVKRAAVAVSRYINSLLPGSELVYNQLIQLIMDSSEEISDVNVSKFSVNGQETLRRNYRPAADEQIVVGNVFVDIARS